MTDLLYSVDRSIFYFVNHSLQNSLFDAAMPFITDLNKNPPAIVVVAVLWLLLLVKGGRQGRIGAVLLVVAVVFSDWFNSCFLKFVFERIRPCHVLPDVHLLVSCGSGYSFPSSHAVNNFTGAAVLSSFVPKGRWALYLFTSVVAFSRVYVGVHYPSDVLAGAIAGIGLGSVAAFLFVKIESWWNERNASTLSSTDTQQEP